MKTINRKDTTVLEMLVKSNKSTIAKTFRPLYKNRNSFVPKTSLTFLVDYEGLPYPYLDGATVNARKMDLIRSGFNIESVRMTVKIGGKNVPKYTFLMLTDGLTELQIEKKIRKLRKKYEVK